MNKTTSGIGQISRDDALFERGYIVANPRPRRPANRSWVVMKVGGTSMSSTVCLDHLIAAVRAHDNHHRRVLIVHSALAGVTDLLEHVCGATGHAREQLLAEVEARHLQMAERLCVDAHDTMRHRFDELRDYAGRADAATPKGRARILAMGELMATGLLHAYCASKYLHGKIFDARELLTAQPVPGQSEVSRYLSAVCHEALAPELIEALEQCSVALTQGFIARDAAGNTVVLGRGGSDTSAAYLAAGLGAVGLEIWTDVPGLFSANPRQVGSARLLAQLDYSEAQEIATSGAKVLHPRLIEPVRRAGVPVSIVCATNPALPRTRISADAADTSGRVKAINVRRGVVLVSMESVSMWRQVGFLADAFACFKRHGLSIDMVSTSETSVTVTLDPLVNPDAHAGLDALLAELQPLCNARAITGCAAITLVGRHIRANLHQLGPALGLFEERQVHMVSQAANDLNLTFVVDELDAPRLVKALHAQLIQTTEHDEPLGKTWDELQRAPAPAACPNRTRAT